MPTYEYKCFACNHQFETEQRISEDALTTCPSCGADELKRLISETSFHLKGSGWYKTDYSSKGASSDKGATESSGDAGASSKDSGDSSAANKGAAPESSPSGEKKTEKTEKKVEKKTSSPID